MDKENSSESASLSAARGDGVQEDATFKCALCGQWKTQEGIDEFAPCMCRVCAKLKTDG